MKKMVKWLTSLVAVVAVAFPAIVMGTSSVAGASTVTYSATQTFTPPSSNFAGTTGGGDGWDIATYNNRVYNVFHHQNYFGLMCHNQSDASACWTTTDTGTSNAYKTITVNGNAFGTSGKPGLYVDQSTGYLYVYATEISTRQPGVLCLNLNAADTVTDPTCSGSGGQPPAWTPLAAPGQTGWSTSNTSTGTVSPTFYNGNFYAWNPVNGAAAGQGGGGATGAGDNTLLCYDIATQSACANEPYAVSVGSTTGTNTDSSPAPPTTLVGSQLFIPSGWSSGGVVACVDLSLSTPGNCGGSWPQSMAAGTQSMVTPLLDSSGNAQGVCGLNSGSSWLCWGLDGSNQPTPTGLTSSTLFSWQWAGSPSVIGTRVFEVTPGFVYCYDFATNAACTTTTSHFPIALANNSSTYSVTPDSQRPTCLWVNADGGSAQIQNFDALTGGSCASAPVRVFASSFVEPYQACTPTSFDTISLTSGNIALSPAPTLSFTNGNGVVIDGPYAFNTSGATPTIDLTSLAYPTPIDLSTKSALPQFVLDLTPGTGGLGTVGVQVTWSGSSLSQCNPGYAGPAPSTSAASGVADTSATFNGSVNNPSTDTVGPVQFCYQTTSFASGQCTGSTVAATAGSSSATVTSYGATPTNLSPSTTYYYELVTSDATTSSPLYGGVEQFTTGPVATTGPVSALTDTSGTFTGSIYNPAGDTLAAAPQFCYQTSSFTTGACHGTTVTAVAGSSSPSGTQYTAAVTGLTAGTTYYYELTAQDQTSSQSLDGGVVSFVAAPVTRTSTPTSVGDSTATISGTAYNPNGDTLSASFCYAPTTFSSGQCSTAVGSLSATASTGSTVASTTGYSAGLSGLSPSTTYDYELVVTDSTTGTTFYGGVKTFSTGPTAATGSALNIEPTTSVLSGSLYNPAGDSFTSVQFCYQDTPFTSGGCLGTTVSAVAGTTTGASTQYTGALASLVPGTTYYYELVATDSALTPSQYVGGVHQFTAGPVVTTLTGSTSSSSATLTGDIVNPNSMALSSVQFCYQDTPFTSGNCSGTSVTAVAGTGSGSTTPYSAVVTGLTDLTTYYFELVANPTTSGGPFLGGVANVETAGIAPTISSATITGTPTVGQTLTANSAGVSGAPTPVETYQWFDNGRAISGATASTYVVQSSDFANAITVTITETNSVGHVSATSSPSSSIAGLVPTISSAAITGTPTVGQTLTATSAGVTGVPTPVETYQWFDNGRAISGATASTYVVQPSDFANAITVTITETNSVGHASATSAPESNVPAIAPTISSATITGTPTVGQTLTAKSAGVTGVPTPVETYQWFDNGQAISGATASTYVVQSSDIGNAITVKVIETNVAGVASATSSPTASIPSNQPPVISTVVVSPTGTGVITWSPVPNTPPSDYVVQYTTNGGQTWETVPASDISGTTATVPGLNTSSNFQFRVSTTTSAGSTTSISKATTPTKALPTSPIALPSKPFAAYQAAFGASSNDIKVIITTLREVSALHLKSVTIIGYAIYETKAHDGKGKYLTMNQVRNLAKSRAYSAIKFMQGLERKLHIAPVKFVVKPVIEMGKSHLKNFEKFRRVTLQI